MTIPRIEALYAAWKRTPPLNKLVAVYLEYKPPLDRGEASPGVEHMSSEMAEAIIRSGGVLISGDMLGGPAGGQR